MWWTSRGAFCSEKLGYSAFIIAARLLYVAIVTSELDLPNIDDVSCSVSRIEVVAIDPPSLFYMGEEVEQSLAIILVLALLHLHL